MFWSREAYEISKKITSNNELHVDLVSHVFLILHHLNISEEDLPRTFAKFAYNQWTWKQSQFNRQYQRGIVNVELPESFTGKTDDENFSEYEDLLIQFLEINPVDDSQMFCKEIARMHLYGMTYRDIRNETDLSLQIIHQAIKQFKNDLYDYYHHSLLNRTGQSSDDIKPARY
jgi:uncharacterized protein YerC